MTWAMWSFLQRKPLPYPTLPYAKPTPFAEVRVEMERIKTRFGVNEDSFIAQALLHFFREIMFTVKSERYQSKYWRGDWRDYPYAGLQVHDLSATGRPSFIGIDHPLKIHPTIRALWEENIASSMAISVTFSEKMILLRNKDFIRISKQVLVAMGAITSWLLVIDYIGHIYFITRIYQQKYQHV